MADYDVKFTWHPNFNLVFSAYQPSGVGRGIPDQPLPEIRDVGFYSATPITDLVDGDVVQVHRLDTVTWEDAIVVYLSEEVSVYWEGDRVYYEGEWVADLDNTVIALVTSKSAPIGSGEFTVPSGEISGLVEDVDDILVTQLAVLNVYDEREQPSVGLSLVSTGLPTQEGGAG